MALRIAGKQLQQLQRSHHITLFQGLSGSIEFLQATTTDGEHLPAHPRRCRSDKVQAAAAMSVPAPSRASEVCLSIVFSMSGVSTVASAAVRMAPGAIALTRMLSGPRSSAIFRVRRLSAAFDAPEEHIRLFLFSPAIELMLTIAPLPAAFMCGG